jgi:hypothetical protein
MPDNPIGGFPATSKLGVLSRFKMAFGHQQGVC